MPYSEKQEKLFREQARLVCGRQAAYYARLMGVEYGRIAIKNTKTCRITGNGENG